MNNYNGTMVSGRCSDPPLTKVTHTLACVPKRGFRKGTRKLTYLVNLQHV